MNKLQSLIKHDSSCSCYQIVFDKYEMAHDCMICDCGELRKTYKEEVLKNGIVNEDLFILFMEHCGAIAKSVNL